MPINRTEALKQIGIRPDSIIYPIEQFNSNGNYDYQTFEPASIADMYGSNDVSRYIMFWGNYINWGYWKGIDVDKTISPADRTQASSQLYDYIFEHLNLSTTSKVLEVGPGLGMGIKTVLTKYQIEDIVGLDLVSEQINRALKLNEELRFNKKVRFLAGDIQKSSLPDNHFTNIYICEVAQHFRNMETVLSELKRIATPNATIVFVAPFPTCQTSRLFLEQIIPYYSINMSLYDINFLKDIIKKTEFAHCEITSIGKYVWKGLDNWLSQHKETKNQWSRVYYPAYQANLIDYYSIILRT